MADDLAVRLKAEAVRLGFDRVGIAPAVAPPGYEHYQDWLRDGCEAGMAYMRTREVARGASRFDPARASARSSSPR